MKSFVAELNIDREREYLAYKVTETWEPISRYMSIALISLYMEALEELRHFYVKEKIEKCVKR